MHILMNCEMHMDKYTIMNSVDTICKLEVVLYRNGGGSFLVRICDNEVGFYIAAMQRAC